jgi:hypothetical protein
MLQVMSGFGVARLVALAAVTAFGVSTAGAQTAEVPAAGAQGQGAESAAGAAAGGRPREVSAKLNFEGVYFFPTDFKSAEGEIGTTRAGVNFSASFPVGEMSEIAFAFNNTLSWYDFDDARAFPARRDGTFQGPLDETFEHELGVRFSTQINERWGWYVGGGVNVAGERGASWSEAATYAALVGLTYTPSRSLLIGPAILVSTRLEDEPTVFPAAIINWQIAEQWRFHTLSPALGNTGRAAILEYAATEQIAFSIGVGFVSSEYRLDADDESPPSKGILRDRAVAAFVGVDWKPTARVSLDVKAGALVWREFELRDSEGNGIMDVETEPTPGVSAALVFRF